MSAYPGEPAGCVATVRVIRGSGGRGYSARYLEYKNDAGGGECSSQCGCLPGVLPADSWYERHVHTSWSVW